MRNVTQGERGAKAYQAPLLSDLGFVSQITGMPGGSVGCEGNSGKQQRVDTGGDVGGDCTGGPNNN